MKHLRNRRLATITTVIAIALGATACQPAYSGPEGRRVAVVGDSITNGSGTAIDAELADAYRFVSGIDSIDLAEGRTKLVKPVVGTKPAVLVIELGINSAREVWDSADLPHLEGVLADIKAIPCVIWVTPTSLATSYYDHLGEGTLNTRIAKFQASLKKRLPKHPQIHLADFGAMSVQHPEWYQADGLHPNDAGRVAYASYTVEQVDTQC